MTAEKLYCVSSPYLRGVKLGHWQGSVKDLRARYNTPYGRVELIVYACQNRRMLETLMMQRLHKYNLVGELFSEQCVDEFNDFCKSHCIDSVPYDKAAFMTSYRVDRRQRLEEIRIARNTAQKTAKLEMNQRRQEIEAEEQQRQQNKKRKRDDRLAKEEASKLEAERKRGEHARLLDDFIRRHCRVEPQLTAITKAFKESFEGTAKTSITTQALAAQMKARGYLREQQTTGLRSMTFKGIELL